VFVELGRRLAALGALEEPRDVFYLTAQEALSFVEGTAATARIGELAALRKREFAAYREGPAPADRFETRGVVYVANPFTASAKKPGAENKNVAVDGETRNGLACCPGVVRARARVVLDPRGVGLAPGEILVAQRTDPGWVMLFPSASGLIVEHGSLLSHSAIVARELGLPAVVALDGATEWLRTGDEIELDGAAGTVRRLQKTKMPAS
jgi:pyruvate,water dikinase